MHMLFERIINKINLISSCYNSDEITYDCLLADVTSLDKKKTLPIGITTMASEYSSKVQIEKLKQLTTAYNDLVKELDGRLEAIVAELDNPNERKFWYDRWKIIYHLMTADYNKRMEGIANGEI